MSVTYRDHSSGVQDVFWAVWHHHLWDLTDSICVWSSLLLTKPLCSDRWGLGALSSVPCLPSAFYLFLQALKQSYSWLSSIQFNLSAFIRRSSAILKPLWVSGYAVHLFTSHQAESPKKVVMHSSVFQACAWRQGNPFLWGHSKELTISGQIVMQRVWGIAFQGGWAPSALLCSCLAPMLWSGFMLLTLYFSFTCRKTNQLYCRVYITVLYHTVKYCIMLFVYWCIMYLKGWLQVLDLKHNSINVNLSTAS